MADLWRTVSERHVELLNALGQHIEISLIALVLAVIIAIPLAVWVQTHPKVAAVLLQVTGVLQTIPSLALLGLLIPFVGIGTVPAIIALVVYALLPIFQNTYIGLQDIDPSYEEAADAFGMSRLRKLFKVELPIALPVILSGVRTAMVLIIGTATLAALIGAGGLGPFILLGIDRNDASLTLMGALAAALLAIVFSWLLNLLQKVNWKLSVSVVGIVLLGFAGTQVYNWATAPKETITIAGKLGSEPDILISMYKELIQKADPDVKVTLKPNFGQTSFLYNALRTDKINIYPEFSGTVLESLTKPTAAQQKQVAAGKNNYPLAQQLLAKQGLRYLKPMAYNNTYALVVKASFAKRYQLKTISDLAKIAPSIRAGFDLEFIDRQDGYKGIKQKYGLQFKVNSMDPSLRYQALDRGQINLTDGYTTDAQLRQYHLVALKDDRGLFPIYRGAPLMRSSFAKHHPHLVTALNKLANHITEKQMQDMNYAVSVRREKAATVAHRYLVRHGLLKEVR
ncbi:MULTISPECIES: ABC transporter permease/substrate-binding protein [Lacticaseibacillus]|uniref:Glycine/betaine ABC transporter permease and substrate binding components n=1 Tax=Lacticaseibacillus casei DSM 20011 = JCM 1134 = ATCC 393 TaxID=1423732 RepID=A0AAD1ART9_LACCA|nr:ABC transporter permease/substrate-binding protein [Lacticaseibacillus casei]MBI6597382.1 ABC transporter permease/substrate-binding protein [Lacticaseibacillus casei]MBO1481032.1 ABC transporter permease/substrate-binding protein [Lacticaseibacillus casei]MBO2416357.1 ABC transporter permease/substrate-binding protein [Lacticaseibacillus casei]MCK2080712.1 ABC transporter permease/substrate-binding protein [Lacticaseibacillus casei]MDZ5495127.1 ABC transporter permease/substrate-binding pr